MAAVSRHKQVLCVTHLPQIAAMADSHFSVEKGESKGRTFTEVTLLAEPERRTELARLTSGSAVTASALENAGEMLDEARQFRESLAKEG